MTEFFGILAGIFPLTAAFPYIRDILRGSTKPHRGSFLIWTVLGAIAFSSQAADGAGWSLLLPAADTLATVVIFGLSINYGVGGLTRRDSLALVISAAALVAWYITKEPLIAMVTTIAIDAIGTGLTLIKTYAEPHTETLSSWTLAALGGVAAAFAVGQLSPALLAYPVYIALANGAVAAVILIKRPHH